MKCFWMGVYQLICTMLGRSIWRNIWKALVRAMPTFCKKKLNTVHIYLQEKKCIYLLQMCLQIIATVISRSWIYCLPRYVLFRVESWTKCQRTMSVVITVLVFHCKLQVHLLRSQTGLVQYRQLRQVILDAEQMLPFWDLFYIYCICPIAVVLELWGSRLGFQRIQCIHSISVFCPNASMPPPNTIMKAVV